MNTIRKRLDLLSTAYHNSTLENKFLIANSELEEKKILFDFEESQNKNNFLTILRLYVN